jgi:threonine/homoserine efflux transporter RhtA
VLLIAITAVAVTIAEVAILGVSHDSNPTTVQLTLAMICAVLGAAIGWTLLSTDGSGRTTGSKVMQVASLLIILTSPIARALTVDFKHQLWVLAFEMMAFAAVTMCAWRYDKLNAGRANRGANNHDAS